MGYWNRDQNESFKCWHDDCFPIYRPTTAEKFCGDGATNADYAAQTFGGIDHLVELALTDTYYAEAIERYLTDDHRWTPDGFAWANWSMGAPCEVCGVRL